MKRKEKKKPVTLSLHVSLWKRVQREARRRNISGAALAAMMFEAGLEKLEKEEIEIYERLVG